MSEMGLPLPVHTAPCDHRHIVLLHKGYRVLKAGLVAAGRMGLPPGTEFQ